MEEKTPSPTRRTNRLIHEKSPYLLQHADNPVDWYSWGEEAFKKARQEDKPIFLSIGYSTCHWCHVMEHESFEDPAVAELLNRHFVSIKVDREERPDLDSLYMQAVMQMTGQGGWPLSAFLTPEGKPFHGGTYFPPEDRWGQPGFKSVLRGVAQAWSDRREEILHSSEALTEALRAGGALAAGGGNPLTEETLTQALQVFSNSYDQEHAGFLPAPKFPRSPALSLLLRIWKRMGDADALRMAEETLRAMAAGGMYDHLGGGFHRYSTDAQWFLPHFEKMLYDQALLAVTYLEAHQATAKPEYAQVAREIFEYVLREMADPQGGFYSAEDADSEAAGVREANPKKQEGAFYVWSAEELNKVLGAERAEVIGFLYGVQPGGNVFHDPMGEFQGKNVLHRRHDLEEAARRFGKTKEQIQALLSEAKDQLFQARSRRPRPHRDDKILTDWNGLMISALALGSRVLEEPRYAQAARKAADFLLGRMVRSDGRPFGSTAHPELVPARGGSASGGEGKRSAQGRLLHRYREGEAGILGTLEDHAFLAHGLFDLYQATFETKYLAQAKRLAQEMIRLFWDEQNGGFFLTGSDAEALLVRQKEIYDGAIPSGNSVAALVLLRLGRLTTERSFEEKARKLLEGFSGPVRQHPDGYPQLLIALDFALGPSREIVLAGQPEAFGMTAMIRAVYRRFLPNKVVALHPPGKAGEEIETLAPFLKGQATLEGNPTAYVCRNYACSLPTTDLDQLEKLLDGRDL